ncbi:glycosyltransferase family 2 protein [Vibrio breoganii]|uniref:glycosyltransferase family 2 protein n=1 Tax=Vibrio breoganii TaxID=553239 RepID=UPI000C8437A6|nr:glycosyltransferase family 2 protein [Vibrio breoganii]PMM19865.1 hypothetical protein BCT59_08740 [Vibrio breoganii]
MTKYTIAIPAYNNEKTIRETIVSCLNQKTEQKFDVLVSDDGSIDNSQNIYKEFQDNPKFKLIVQNDNSTLYGNHNNCLKYTDSDYVLFCHADDILFDDALKKIDLGLSKYGYPEKIVCFGRSFFRDFYRSYKHVAELNSVVSGVSAQELFQYGGLTPSGTCYSRRTFLESGGFLPMRSTITASDMSSMIKYSLEGAEFLMLDRILFKREYASTAVGLTQNDTYRACKESLEELKLAIDKDKFDNLYLNIITFGKVNLEYFAILSELTNNKENKFKIKIQYFLKHPLCLKNSHLRRLLFT